jgi:DNA polymerase (family X)
MSSAQKHPLTLMRKLAERVAGELSEYCDQIEIAGSIRRGRPFCGDVDIVALPKPGKVDELKARCLRNATPVRDGDQEFVCTLTNGIQLDVWLAAQPAKDFFESKPTNFGSLLLCRTGSPAHNICLIERAKSLGLRWNPHWGVYGGLSRGPIASVTEEEIFAALKLEFVPPEKREC